MSVSPSMSHHRRQILSWACYDWANSAFATVVMAGFFPVFFKQFWAADLPVTDSTFRLGLVNSIASLIIVCAAPLLGALADQLGAKKRFLLLFTLLGVLAAGGLFWVAQGQWQLALMLYLAGLLGFSGSNVFYDALLTDITRADRYERVSALGYAVGYLGGGLLFAFDVLLTLRPGWFGLAGQAEAVRVAFLSVGIWWAVFALPLAIWVPEPPGQVRVGLGPVLRSTLRELAATMREMRRLPNSFLFLVAYWCYIDGVDTIVRMAVDFGLAIGFEAADLMLALLLVQAVGFPAALVFGRLGERWGAKRGILVAIGAYLLIVVGATQMREALHFYLLAVAIGLVQGGIQALSRALFASLIPAGETAKFFGFFNMVGKFAAVLGPALVGAAAALTGDPRLSLVPILLLFLAGALLLLRVDVAAGRADAATFRLERR